MTITTTTETMTGTWASQLRSARQAAADAAEAIRLDFGVRHITSRKGPFDIQLRADLTAQSVIVERLRRDFPGYAVVAEEDLESAWLADVPTWVVDPLDGTNNFGYGVAHCAIAISLFARDEVVLAVVRDPLLGREFIAADGLPRTVSPGIPVSLADATVSLVSNYTRAARQRIGVVEEALGQRCKRVLRLWSPALDLALVADGQLDAVVCLNAKLLDVCAGGYLVRASGGLLTDLRGRELTLTRSMRSEPVSFIATRDAQLTSMLCDVLGQAHDG